MELIQIIILSLKLFTVTAILVISIAYVVYKLRTKNEVKPHLRSTVFSSEPAFESTEMAFGEYAESVPGYNQQDQRFNIVNEHQTVGNSYYQNENFQPSQNNDQNIYYYYSTNRNEQMHKVRT